MAATKDELGEECGPQEVSPEGVYVGDLRVPRIGGQRKDLDPLLPQKRDDFLTFIQEVVGRFGEEDGRSRVEFPGVAFLQMLGDQVGQLVDVAPVGVVLVELRDRKPEQPRGSFVSLQAGLLPALAAGVLGTGSDWRFAVMRPGDRPLRWLARMLLEPAVLGHELGADPHDSAGKSREELLPLIEAELSRGPLGLVHLVDDARSRAGRPPAFNLLLLVDQFEEIFRYSATGMAQADEAGAFVNLLLASRATDQAGIYVALTMRSEFLGNCVRFLQLPEAINQSQYLTPRLTRVQLESAIVSPARVFGGDVEAEVTNELINAVADDPDQLPVLQHALARMWEAAAHPNGVVPVIRPQDLSDTGGVNGALSRHADSILGGLLPPQRELAEALFRAITERGSADTGARDTRRPLRLGRIAKAASRPWPEFLPVIQAFSREGVNFLTHEDPLDAEAHIDISHEALIRQWESLRSWVADDADQADDYRRWRDRARQWATEGGELLAGADLARAVQWREGRDGWRPTPEWAELYGFAGDISRKDYEKTLDYISKSEAHARAQREETEAAARRELEREQRRTAAEMRAAEAQAEVERQKAAASAAEAGAERQKAAAAAAQAGAARERAAAERERAEAAARERGLAEASARRSRKLSLLAGHRRCCRRVCDLRRCDVEERARFRTPCPRR